MELATIFLIWLVVTIIDNLAKRKKRRVPPPESSPDFEIPTLANDPNFPGEEVPVVLDTPKQVEVRPKNPPPRLKRIAAQDVNETEKAPEIDLTLTQATLINAFVFKEILDKPKALRRR